jgi:hypothetical protein
MFREVHRSGEGRRERVRDAGDNWRHSHCLSDPVSARVLAARHDGTRPAHAR